MVNPQIGDLPQRSMSRLWLLLVMAIGCAPRNTYDPPPPPTVTVAQPLVKDVTVYLEQDAQTEAVHRAEVRARVRGFVEEIRFEPGAEVQESDVLYVIERQQYKASLQSAQAARLAAQAEQSAAEAGIAVAQAGLQAAEAELLQRETAFKRVDALLPQRAVSAEQWEEAQAARDAAIAQRNAAAANQASAAATLQRAEAQVKVAEANLNQAQINYDYTEVKAPISGRISKTDVTRGNLVADGELLATVVADSPVWANFNISERTMLRLQRTRTRSESFKYQQLPAFLQRSGDDGFPYAGHLDYIDPEVSADTGTLAVRAIFDNSDDKQRIIPGIFARVRIPVAELSNALLIPEIALGRDQAGVFVLVVGADNMVSRKNVEVGNKQRDQVVITAGLAPQDWVVVAGLQRARPGLEVAPQQIDLVSSPAAEPQDVSEATPSSS